MESPKDIFRIIVIDDNPAIHQDFIKILSSKSNVEMDEMALKIFGESPEDDEEQNFQIDTASQGKEGLDRIKQSIAEKNPYSLAFVDIRMPPGWDGIETIKHIWEIDKDIQVVICTAYTDYSWEETVSHLGKTDNLLILKKPFDTIAVRQLACALTKKWELSLQTKMQTDTLNQQVEDRTTSLKQSLSLVKATLESSNDGILVVNEEGKIIDYNKRFISMCDVPQFVMDSTFEENVLSFLKEQLEDPDSFFKAIKKLHIEDSINIDVVKLKNGKILECYSLPQLLNGKTVGRVITFRDITKRNLLEKQLVHQATHDALTGLPNRIMLMDHIKASIETARKTKMQFALLFLDLDRFKLINDSLSHAVGDDLLKITADRIQSILHTNDVLARLGGDEFVIVIHNITSEKDVISVAKTVLDVFHNPFNIANREVTITSSIGISVYPQDGVSIDLLLRNADAAMYHAKELGANNFQFYTDDMNVINLAKLDQEMQLRHAMANNKLFLCYQPEINVETGKLVAVEALIRWNHPEKGLLLPIDFVPLAEETGLIVPIGEWVLRTVCVLSKELKDKGIPPIRIALNVAEAQIKQNNFVEMVKNILQETNADPAYIELELTENIIISNLEIIRKVTALKDLGVSIAIDDFGTGYSSLSYLKKLPLDRLKIDGSFIQQIKEAGDDEVIIRAIIAIAQNLNLEVLAEGVETKSQLNFLKDNKCDDIQGYYFSKPLSLEDFKKLLLKNLKSKSSSA